MINAIRKYFRKRAERAALNAELQASLDRMQDAEFRAGSYIHRAGAPYTLPGCENPESYDWDCIPVSDDAPRYERESGPLADARLGDYVEAFDGTIGRLMSVSFPETGVRFYVAWSDFGRDSGYRCFGCYHDQAGSLALSQLVGLDLGGLRIKRILPDGAVRYIYPAPFGLYDDALRHVATLKCRRTGRRLKVYGGGRGDQPSPIFDTLELGI